MLVAAWFALCGMPAAGATVLYDGAALPASEGWLSFSTGGPPTLGSGFVGLDTSSNPAIQGGYARLDQDLDSGTGFELSFAVQIVSEAHADNNRAGFSLIVMDDTRHGIELGFWQDHIWAQALGFTHAEDIAFDTTSMTHYDLIVTGGSYRLIAGTGAAAITLSGATRFYDAPGLVFAPDFPYRTPNAIFLGDDTTSAAGSFDLASVSVQAVPEPVIATMLAAGLMALALIVAPQRRSR